MLRAWRWAVVAAGVSALVATPGLVARLPVAEGAPAADVGRLLARVQASRATPYAGYAEATGGLLLPVADQLTSLTELLGGRTQLRAWWRGATDWRVDSVGLFGERGVHRDRDRVWSWDYETNRATEATADLAGEVRLPAAADLLPAELGRRLLGGARSQEVSPLPARRVAGRAADGLRLRPTDPHSSVARVDVWADRASGVPLAVALYGRGATLPAMSTAFLDFSPRRPTAAETAFVPPATARVRSETTYDLSDVAARIPTVPPPDQLLGMARSTRLTESGSVGVYGRGVTELVVAPMPRRFGPDLREQLSRAPGVTDTEAGLGLAVGPLSLLVTPGDSTGRVWLLCGTVTPAALAKAAAEMAPGWGRVG